MHQSDTVEFESYIPSHSVTKEITLIMPATHSVDYCLNSNFD